MALQRINQELEDKLYRMVRPPTHTVPSLSIPLWEVGSRKAKPVQAAQRMATGFWHLPNTCSCSVKGVQFLPVSKLRSKGGGQVGAGLC